MDRDKLIEKAIEAKNFSYSPYSKFRVGAALLTNNNEIITGCNVENASYGLTICAERTAIFKAYSEGKRRFKAIAISSDDKNFCPPCGACRQIIWELCGDIDVILIDGNRNTKTFKASDFLPFPFGDENLKGVTQ
ncbi:MAG: cytidine deaminase [Ignavibacteria bacterium]|jgi:cytidine deaminase|nr:cytidine deaminase [Ignavibacteria bacterium]MDH7528752.1 cytidine deaminase [Ignavibacteria bacterium]